MAEDKEKEKTILSESCTLRIQLLPSHCLIWAKDVLLIITVCPEIRRRQEEALQI